MKENYNQYAVAGKVLHYNQENLIKVARIIKPEGELTEEDLSSGAGVGEDKKGDDIATAR